MVSSEPSDREPDPTEQTDESTGSGDLPTRPAAEARPGQDPDGVDDTGGPTDPEHPSG